MRLVPRTVAAKMRTCAKYGTGNPIQTLCGFTWQARWPSLHLMTAFREHCSQCSRKANSCRLTRLLQVRFHLRRFAPQWATVERPRAPPSGYRSRRLLYDRDKHGLFCRQRHRRWFHECESPCFPAASPESRNTQFPPGIDIATDVTIALLFT